MYSYAPTSVCNCKGTPSVVALGCFDGVHTGHRQLLAIARERADALGLSLVVYSPEAYKPGQASLLTSEEKIALLHSLGADRVILADFDAIKHLSATDFVQRVLFSELDCQVAVCGYNFTFGHKASGDAATLQTLMQENGKTAIVAAAVRDEKDVISSTRIRQLLKNGEVATATELLKRPFSLSGRVCHGRAIGRAIGFPTLNLPFPPNKLVPKFGVYYAHVQVGATLYAAVINVGMRPTFPDTPPAPLLEAHLLDFAGDLYGKEVTVFLLAFLRGEMAFPCVKALSAQIQKDVLSARACADADLSFQNK